jgi:hypothetical protein
MADDKRKTKSKGKRARSTALTGLLAVVALVAIWLSDCIPGFGIGAGSKDGEGEQVDSPEPAQPAEPAEPAAEPAEPSEPAPTLGEGERKLAPMQLTIDARGCSIAGGDPLDCASLCEDEARFADVDTVIIDAEHGPQAAVEAALECAKAKGLSVKLTRE